MFDMKNLKHKGKRFLFAFLLLFSAFFVVPKPAAAFDVGLDTSEVTGDVCSYAGYVSSELTWKWWKKPMEAVVDASVSVGNKTYKKLGPEMAKIVGIGFGIWLALFSMKVVGSFVEASPGETMTRLGGMSIKVMLACGLMATSTGRKTFFEYFFSPVIELGALHSIVSLS